MQLFVKQKQHSCALHYLSDLTYFALIVLGSVARSNKGIKLQGRDKEKHFFHSVCESVCTDTVKVTSGFQSHHADLG